MPDACFAINRWWHCHQTSEIPGKMRIVCKAAPKADFPNRQGRTTQKTACFAHADQTQNIRKPTAGLLQASLQRAAGCFKCRSDFVDCPAASDILFKDCKKLPDNWSLRTNCRRGSGHIGQERIGRRDRLKTVPVDAETKPATGKVELVIDPALAHLNLSAPPPTLIHASN